MLIDCGTCPARDRACDDCAVGVLLTLAPPRRDEACLDPAERAAVDLFVRCGLVDADEAQGLVAVVDPAAVAV